MVLPSGRRAVGGLSSRASFVTKPSSPPCLSAFRPGVALSRLRSCSPLPQVPLLSSSFSPYQLFFVFPTVVGLLRSRARRGCTSAAPQHTPRFCPALYLLYSQHLHHPSYQTRPAHVRDVRGAPDPGGDARRRRQGTSAVLVRSCRANCLSLSASSSRPRRVWSSFGSSDESVSLEDTVARCQSRQHGRARPEQTRSPYAYLGDDCNPGMPGAPFSQYTRFHRRVPGRSGWRYFDVMPMKRRIPQAVTRAAGVRQFGQ